MLDERGKSLTSEKRPKVGVGVFVKNDEGKILMQRRIGAHGEGTWCLPGGHLEFGESWETCAKRETKEEFGVDIKNIQFFTATNDHFKDEDKHYITLFMLSEIASGTPSIKEPDKATEWAWKSWEDLPTPLFLPIVNLKEQGFNP